MQKSKIIIAGTLILVSIVFIIVSSTLSSAQYFITLNELLSNSKAFVDKEIRISGLVIGNSIKYNHEEKSFTFIILPMDADRKHNQNNEKPVELTIQYKGVKPDLLIDGAQVIASGHLVSTGIFEANELLLKCPSKYEGQDYKK